MVINPEHVLTACAALATACIAYGLTVLLLPGKLAAIDQRLRETLIPLPQAPRQRRVAGALDRIGRTVGQPFAPHSRAERTALQEQLTRAGIYGSTSLYLIAGIKVVGLIVGIGGGYGVGQMFGQPWIGLGLGGILALVLPNIWLGIRTSRHQRRLEEGLPDALDLMVVCIEAGLTLDAGLQRVGKELQYAHPELARELMLTHMESQIGVTHPDALRNFSHRTGSASVQSLAAMLIQAERFGTGIAQALRVHAESLRLRRRYQAEERAAKASVKLAFPLVLCIFPAMLVLLGGPALVRMMEAGFYRR